MKVLLTACFVWMALCLQAQSFNRLYPPDMAPYGFQQYDTTSCGAYFLAPYKIGLNEPYLPHLAVMDENGYLLWYKRFYDSFNLPMDFKMQENGYYTYAFHEVSYQPPKHYVMDQQFNLIDSVEAVGYTTDNHDFMILPNGNYLVLSYHDSIMDLSTMIFNGNPGSPTTNVMSCVIQELDANRNVVFEWNSLDHIPITDYVEEYGFSQGFFTAVHANSLELDTDGNLLVSFRHLSAVYKIDRTTGGIIWKLGGEQNDFNFLNDGGFTGQHDAQLANGKLSLFDNGTLSTPQASRGVVYDLNMGDTSVQKTWEFYYPTSLYGPSMGSFKYLENGCKVVSWGMSFRPDPTFTVLNGNDDISAQLFLSDSTQTYRTYYSELSAALPRPEVDCSDNGSIVLSAPNGYLDYVWSTGATTQTITVNDTGYYQVYVNYGDGMLASDPVYIASLQNPCLGVSIEEYEPRPKGKLIGVYDLVGRQVKQGSIGHIYIRLYENGYAEKFVFTTHDQ
jgi:hypothetical protein